METKQVLIVLFALTLIQIVGIQYKRQNRPTNKPVVQQQVIAPIPEVIRDKKPEIAVQNPTRELSLEEIYAVLDQWNKEAPEITNVGIVGKTHENRDIKYIRIGKQNGPKVLIMATIHGNEKLCTMTALSIMNNILKGYLADDQITELLRTRDIYYIPVVSPEGYINNSRHIHGVDPNRNFNGPRMSEKQSIASIQALKKFAEEQKFDAVMSCHDFGRIYFYPWGYTNNKTGLDADYRRVLGEMASVSKYRYVQLYRNTAAPFYGYEVDYFHDKGAFAIVNEIGRGFTARPEEIIQEVQDNQKAFLIFIEKAPLVRPAFYSILE